MMFRRTHGFLLVWAATTLVLAAITCSVHAGEPKEDRIPHNVFIEAKVVEWTGDSTFDMGLSWLLSPEATETEASGLIDAGAVFPSEAITPGLTVFLDKLNISDRDLRIVLEALETSGTVKLISRPSVMVMDCADIDIPPDKKAEYGAVVRTGRNLPYESAKVSGSTTVSITEFTETGVMLHIIPRIRDDNVTIELDIEAKVTDLREEISIGLNDRGEEIRVPVISTRRTQNTVIVYDGVTLVLGGLYTTEKTSSLRRIPYLNVVPWVGSLFEGRHEEEKKVELLFFITPRIWRGAGDVGMRRAEEEGAAGEPETRTPGTNDAVTPSLQTAPIPAEEPAR